jgi:hypothetical protein
MNEESLATRAYLEKIRAHLERADNTLAYLDKAFDTAISLVDNPPTGALVACFEPFLCILSLAPLEKVMACLTGGGLVCAIIGTKAEWRISASSSRGTVRIVQIIACSADEAKVIYSGGKVEILKLPAKMILGGCLFWVGG